MNKPGRVNDDAQHERLIVTPNIGSLLNRKEPTLFPLFISQILYKIPINMRLQHSTLHSISPPHINYIPMATSQIKTGDDQFEFGCVTTTPGSPCSPADHFFSNGKLLPHVFPTHKNISYSRSTSRTSSISTSSRDSFMSSRSNSTNSRNSTCSSARSSISEVMNDKNRFAPDRNAPGRKSVDKGRKSNACQYQYGASQKWQFIAAAPVLRHQGSRSRKVETTLHRNGSKKTSTGSKKPCFGRRILKAFVSACQECHAIKT